MARLGDIGKIVTGNTPKTSESQNYTSNDICFVKPSDIADGIVTCLNDSEFYISEYARAKARILPPKSVLVTCIGIIGKVAINDVECAFNQQINAIIPDNSKCLTEYLAYAIQNKQPEMQDVANAPVVPILNKTQFSDIEINLPSLTEQEEIVGKLNAASRLIALRKAQLAKLDQLDKSRFVELFGDIVLNPFNWEKEQLGMVCDVRDGTHDSPQYYETGYPLVTSKNVTGGKIDLTDCSLICEADFNKINERSKVDIGDIIMPMIGTVGKPVIVDVEPNFAIKNVSLIKFKDHSRVLNIFIRALLQSDYFDEAVLSKVRGGTQKFISLGDIRKLAVIVPPMALQDQFAAFVEQTDKSKSAIQQSLDKLETLKKSLMQEYFG